MPLMPGQKACIETLSGPLAVSAGAGSGKTFTLTRRIVNALATGYVDDVDQIMAITFTAKAAGEIKSRVKGALRAEGRIDQALKVDGAWISTIHGACARILRAHALELGVNPAFSVLAEADADAMLDAAMDDVLGVADELVSPGGLDALFEEYPARSYGGAGTSVEGIVRTLVMEAKQRPEGMAAVAVPARPQSPYQVLARMAQAAGDVAACAQGQKASKSRDALLDGTADALAALEQAQAAPDLTYDQAISVMNRFPVPGKRFGTADFKERMVELAQTYLACMAEARLGLAAPLLQDAISLAGQVLQAYARRKAAAGVLDNDDLLTCASRAFEQHPSIAREYGQKFKLVMVDEFQDTSQMQVDMVKRMSGAGFERLCTVGDAQQSIYRFRGADVGVYNRHLASVAERNPEGLIELADNFRSHVDVLAFVDCVFSQPQVFGRSFMSLEAGRDEAKVEHPFGQASGPRIEVQLTTRPARGVSGDDAAEAAAQRVARRLAQLHEAGHGAGEMVVLLGSMRRADVYADALRAAGLPCVVAGGSIFGSAPEVRLMVALANVAANPNDTTSLFQVLSSGMFALSADDLLELSTRTDEATGVPRRRALDVGFRRLAKDAAQGRALAPQLACAVQVLEKLGRQAGRVPLSQAMMGAVVDSGWLARLRAQGAEGQACAANVCKAVRMVEDAEREGAFGWAGAARAFAQRVEVAKEAPGALSAAGGQFVRIMTVHASKGLEFPIVAVGEVRADDARASGLVAGAAGGRVYVSLDAGRSLARHREKASSLASKSGDYQPFADCGEDEAAAEVQRAETAADARAALRQLEAQAEAAETRRLLYVALTRAKEALVLAMCGKRTKADPTGLARHVYGDVQSALCGPEGSFEQGVTMRDFGGSAPARVERVDLEAEGAEAEAEVAGEAPEPAEAPEVAEPPEPEPAWVDIPEVAPYEEPAETPYRPTREGVFSYSSIAGGAHGDPAADADEAGATESAEPTEPALGEPDTPDAPAAFASEDDAAWDAICASLSDADAATDLGTAFHRLAQYAVCARAAAGQGGALERPPAARQQALARACNLSEAQQQRLDAALDRWFNSQLAARVATYADVRAEVPFFLQLTVGDGGNVIDHMAHGSSDAAGLPAARRRLAEAPFMEGEIDLLATNGPGGEALVVDYKTGGRASETPHRLHEKHVLQATCYACAVLQQGHSAVEAVFVRVEQPREDAPSEPQTVTYRFEAADLPAIKQTIAAVYARKWDNNRG